jgi:flagellar operon protein
MQIQNSPYLSAGKIRTDYSSTQSTSDKELTANGLSFKEILKSREDSSTSQVRFSRHAAGRLSDRNITLTDSQLERLSEGTQKAEQKGIKDSLVIVDDLAFIVNVPSSTVVTAMDQKETQENVFTNIDGAVIA